MLDPIDKLADETVALTTSCHREAQLEPKHQHIGKKTVPRLELQETDI